MDPTPSVWSRRVGGAPRSPFGRAGLLFMAGSACFALGSVPVYFQNAPALAVGVTFFIGSLLFTTAGVTQLLIEVGPTGSRRWLQRSSRTWWAAVVQLTGMLFFNVNTFRAAFVDVPPGQVDRLIWAPDLLGSVAFLIASHLAWLAVCGRWWCVRRTEAVWWIAALNYIGSGWFMAAALAAFVLPTTGEVLNITIVNAGTFLGAAAFFAGGWLLLPGTRPSGGGGAD